MKLFVEIKDAVISIVKSFSFVFKNNLWFYFFVPVVFLVFLYFGGKVVYEELVQKFDFSVLQSANFNDLLFSKNNTDYIVAGIELISIYIVTNYAPYIVLFLMVPFQIIMTSKTDRIMTGFKRKSSVKDYLRDMKTAIKIITRNLAINLLYVGAWLIISLIIKAFVEFKYMDIIDIGVIYLIGFYFYGFSLIDYTTERRGYSYEERVLFCRKHFGITFTIGLFYSLVFHLPYAAGVIIAPVIGIVSATIASVKIIENEKHNKTQPDNLISKVNLESKGKY